MNFPEIRRRTMDFDTFTGGMFDTNCFFLRDERILIDAPQDAADWLQRASHKVEWLLLTHGHIDHVLDAARIQREHGCKVGFHPDTAPMLSDPNFFRRFGFQMEVESVAPDFLIDEMASVAVGKRVFQTLLVPGHCPGSLCFYAKEDRILFGGDVLFASGVGRWDLPGGDRDLLFSGIKTKLFPLGDDVKVYPGHGPATTIGRERASNPYLQ